MDAKYHTRRQLMMECYEGKPPTGYEWLNYIQNTSYAYINTGVYPNSTVRAEIVVERSGTASTTAGIIASADDGRQQFSLVYLTNNRMYYRYGNKYINPSALTFSTGKKTIVMDKNVITMNGSSYTISGTTWSGGTATHAIWMFRGASNSAAYSLMRLYSAKIIIDGEVVRDYRPAKRLRDNKCGLWDLINSTFTASATTSNFTGG